jgi:diaminopimelate epimerase
MGEPIIEPAKVPVDVTRLRKVGQHEFEVPLDHPKRALFEWPSEFLATFVSMGNPHAVVYVSDTSKIEAEHLGPVIEHHSAFPKRINAHWVQVISPKEVRMRTWERGSGITLACGTGACAVCVAGVLTGRTGRNLLAHLPGGDLQLEWRESDNNVYMTGPATEVFSGEWAGV